MTDPVISETFGPIAGPWTLETLVIASLKRWLWPTYLEEIERQNGLPYRSIDRPGTIRGSADLTDWSGGEVPAVIVVCEEPEGNAYRTSEGYDVAYKVTVGAMVLDDERDDARRGAGLYAAAIAGVLTQQLAGDTPEFIQTVMMTAAPSVSLQDPDLRNEYTGQVTCSVQVGPVLNQDLGPLEPVEEGKTPPDWPTVRTPDVELSFEQ